MTESPDSRQVRCRPSGGSLVDLNGITVDLQMRSAPSRFSASSQPVPMLIESSCVLRDRYVVERQIGQGGKGTVFKALDRYRAALPQSQQYVAIKVLHAPSGSGNESEAARLAARKNKFGAGQPIFLLTFET